MTNNPADLETSTQIEHKQERIVAPIRQYTYSWRQFSRGEIYAPAKPADNPSSRTETSEDTSDKTKFEPGTAITESKKDLLSNTEDDPNVDGGYAWLILITSFFTIVFISSIFYYFGVFVPIYVEEFHANQASVAWVGSIGVCFLAFIGIWAGPLADYFGNPWMVFFGGILVSLGLLFASFAHDLWALYLTQGCMVGIGGCLGYTAAVGVVSQWFLKKRGFAVGVTVAGSGLGQFAMSLVTRKLLTVCGWRRALQYLALIHGTILLICSCITKRRFPTKSTLSFQSSVTYFQDRNFALLFSMQVCNSLGFYMPSTFIVMYCLNKGLGSSEGVLILSLMGAASAFGRVTMGSVADIVGKLPMLRICMTISALSMFAWIGCTSFNSILAFAIVYGIFSGGYISLTPSVSADLFGVKNISTIVGLVYSGAFPNLFVCV